ncbi:peptidase S41-like protein [Neolewinella xylanilytica]|uniref:Peptidase S41-like protein n=1 Tax=Neolewinella xylanilytica TaxID=1514080 RepID=A0A2S6I607_9BACT|nr:S41 family peptidase [Neolewinella xylanilytica]PPK86569.1 peptidase S41-like protein [Neolewinella xylanilytica]
MRSCLSVLCILLSVLGNGQDVARDTVSAYLDEFFHIVSTSVLDREQYDWAALRARADRLTAGATTTAETYPGLREVLREVNPHSFIADPDYSEKWKSGGGTGSSEPPPQIPQATGRVISPTVSYVNLPMVNSGHPPTLQHFADSLQRLIARLDGPETKAWIVDLQGNTGGNCWPMLAGIGPVLGRGTAGYFMNRDGSRATSWGYRNGASGSGRQRITEVSGDAYRLRNPDPPVAVLTDGRTASSGEVLAVSFRGRPRTRTFGTPTAGYSTTNSTIFLSDGAMLQLTVSVYGDRNKQAYGEKLIPDVVSQDPLTDAVQWLEAFLKGVAKP